MVCSPRSFREDNKVYPFLVPSSVCVCVCARVACVYMRACTCACAFLVCGCPCVPYVNACVYMIMPITQAAVLRLAPTSRVSDV